VKVEIGVRGILAYQITIFAACEGAKPFSKIHSVQVRNISESPIAEILNEDSRLALKSTERAKSLGTWQRSRTMWANRHKRRLEKLYVYCPSNADKTSDKDQPVDHYGADHCTYSEGLRDTTWNRLCA
jgi:hypothetical protein